MCLKFIVFAALIYSGAGEVVIGQDELVDEVSGLYTIEGRVAPPESIFPPGQGSPGSRGAPMSKETSKWQTEVSITINDGEFKGFVREDGQFIISGVPSGSYILDVHHPDVFYEPVSNRDSLKKFPLIVLLYRSVWKSIPKESSVPVK